MHQPPLQRAVTFLSVLCVAAAAAGATPHPRHFGPLATVLFPLAGDPSLATAATGTDADPESGTQNDPDTPSFIRVAPPHTLDEWPALLRLEAARAREAKRRGLLLAMADPGPAGESTYVQSIQKARVVGRDAAVAAASAYPDGDLMLLCPADVRDLEPDGRSLVIGLLEGMASIGNGRVHLLFALEAHAAPAPAMVTVRRRAVETLRPRLSASAFGRLCVGWWIPAASVGQFTSSSFRESLCGTQLLSDGYGYVDVPAGVLRDLGFERHTPLEGTIRAGAIAVGGQPALALRTPGGAGIVVWDGFSGGAIAGGSTSLSRIALDTGELVALETTPPGELVLPPCDAMTFYDGFAMNEILVEAAMWCEVESWEVEGNRQSIRFGVGNGTEFAMEGAVLCVPGDPFSVTPGKLPFALSFGEETSVGARVAGPMEPGGTIGLSFVLSSPGDVVVSREFAYPVPPKALWQAEAAGDPVGGPVLVDLTDDGETELVWATTSGSVVCLDPDGRLLWEGKLSGQPLVGPVAGRQWHGLPCVVLADETGAVHGFDAGGIPLWQWAPADKVRPVALASASLHPSPGTEYAVAYGNGDVYGLYPDGTKSWQIRVDGSIHSVTAVADRDGYDGLVVLAAGDSPCCYFLAHDGALRWRLPLSRQPVAVPAGYDGLIYVADGDRVRVVDPLGGENESAAITAAFGPLTGVLPVSGFDGLEHVLVMTSMEHTEVRGPDGASLWSALVGSAEAPAMVREGGRAGVAVAGNDDALYLFNGRGEVCWEDHRAGHGLCAGPVVLRPAAQPSRVVQASYDGFLRVVDVSSPMLATDTAAP